MTRQTVRSMSDRPGSLWRDWTLSCTAGEVIGIGAAAATAYLVGVTIGEPDGTAERVVGVAAMVGAGFIEGLAIGFFQWRVIRRPFPDLSGRDWMAATVVVAMLGWLFGMLPSTLNAGGGEAASSDVVFDPSAGQMAAMAAAFGLVAGVLFGSAQWLVLRHHARNAAVWVLGNALGWAAALFWIFAVAGSIPEGTSMGWVVASGVLAGLLAGLSVGMATGLFLLRLQPKVAPPAVRAGRSEEVSA